ncbi:MAG: PIN domain-containing protein, partial [Bacteroidota bacterium]|nr:PIN domain-containing protein [Bacteroidota bacterium]
MAYKAFLDINIVVDFIDESRKEHLSSHLLFNEIAEGNLLGYISESVVNTTFYVTRKQTTVHNFCLFMQDVLDILKILPCTNESVEQAYNIAKNDLEDAVLYQIALSNKMDFFITNDKKDFNKIVH